MTAMLGRGLNTLGSLLGSLTMTNERIEGSEKKRFTSPITQQDIDGKIWWDYEIGDERYQENGYKMPINVLPTVHFEFDNTSPPKHVDIVITSFWSKISPTRSEQKTLIRKLLHLFRSTGYTRCPSFSNLFQIVALTANMDNLKKRNRYKERVKIFLDSGISLPSKSEPKAESLKRIEGTSVVVDGMGTHNFAASDLDLTKPIFIGREKLRLEDFPTTRNTNFKVSDIYNLNWEENYKKEFQ